MGGPSSSSSPRRSFGTKQGLTMGLGIIGMSIQLPKRLDVLTQLETVFFLGNTQRHISEKWIRDSNALFLSNSYPVITMKSSISYYLLRS